MRTPIALTGIAVALVAAALYFALTPVQTNGGVECGSWVNPNRSSAQQSDAANAYAADEIGLPYKSDTVAEKCDTARADQIPPTAILGLAGLGLGVAGLTATYATRRNESATSRA